MAVDASKTKVRNVESRGPFVGVSAYCGSLFSYGSHGKVKRPTLVIPAPRTAVIPIILPNRPDFVHLCAPALVASDILPLIKTGSGGLGRKGTVIYYSGKDMTLGILLRILLAGEQAVGEVGLPKNEVLDPSVSTMDVSASLGGYYVGAHTDYANKFHYFATVN